MQRSMMTQWSLCLLASDVSVEKPLPPVFVDDVKEKETRKDDESKKPDDRKEEEMKVEDFTFESLAREAIRGHGS